MANPRAHSPANICVVSPTAYASARVEKRVLATERRASGKSVCLDKPERRSRRLGAIGTTERAQTRMGYAVTVGLGLEFVSALAPLCHILHPAGRVPAAFQIPACNLLPLRDE